MRVPPWLFAALVLLGVCVIGVFIVKSKHDGVPEGFTNAVPSATTPPPDLPASATPMPSTVANPTTQAQVAQLLQQLQTRIPQLPPANPAAAQATPTGALGTAPAALTDGSGSTYVPNQTRILPHQPLPGQLPSLVASAPPDAAMSQQIQDASANLSPSVRQMIRDEVKKELPEVISEYEIKYTTAPVAA